MDRASVFWNAFVQKDWKNALSRSWASDSHHLELSSSSSSDVYIIFFGIAANLMILAACVTTSMFMRRKRAMMKIAPPSPLHLTSSSSSRRDAKKQRDRVDHAAAENVDEGMQIQAHEESPATMVLAPHVHPSQRMPFNVSPDAFRLLANCPPPHVGSVQQPLPAAFTRLIQPSSMDSDVQAMLIASANVDHFFKMQQMQRLPHHEGNSMVLSPMDSAVAAAAPRVDGKGSGSCISWTLN